MKRQIFIYSLLTFILGVMVASAYFSLSRNAALKVSQDGWQKLNLILSQIDANYVENVDHQAVTDAAVSAALQKLDPHSVYMAPRELKDAEDDLAGSFEGVGLQFNVPNDTAVVLAVIPGGPSEKAGLLAGDRILKVDEKNIAGTKTPQDSMVHLMRGPKGTKVVLTVGRGTEEIPFNITRDKIPEHCVDAHFMLNDTTGYLRLSKFTRSTYTECHEAAMALKAKGMKRLIFDLRGNSGGFFDQACALADDYLEKGAPIVYMQGLHRKREDVKADGRGKLTDLAITVLIDDGSASASEIFAGAIQDNDRGIVVGRRSFGKGLVQEPVYFTDGSGIRLTVARFYTPSGRCIQKPYSDDYAYDFYTRYSSGELMSADSIKVDSSKVYKTAGGRTVYGGGGIIPDVFVPLDTTKATNFHIECNKKAVVMRYATYFLDKHSSSLPKITEYKALEPYFASNGIEEDFLRFAASLGIRPAKGEWEQSREYLLPQIKGLCGRYSKVGEEAYYRYVLPQDDVVKAALAADSRVRL